MGYFVEVMCDVRKSWPKHAKYASKLVPRCLTDRNENPQGRTLNEAKTAARKEGWMVGLNGAAICPKCRKALPEEDQP